MLAKISTKWWWLIILAILVNAYGLFSPVLNSNDAYFYAVISKSLVNSHNWINLMYGGQDWLDKPHLPFWLTALSFSIFGISAFSYVLPGFVFHCLGAIYTYRLAKHLYNQATGIFAALIYVTSLHLLLSALDIRAEAYLLGEIVPALYYWLCYDEKARFKSLILASLFTALALMTKGLFVVVTIFGGLVVMWLYQKRYWEIIKPKWLIAYLLSLVFILPEIISLYLQFDAHPEKLVFGQTHISGIKWYFWGSQFGRFFNDGPIINTHGNPFFFVHTFLWAFLPWSLIFIVAIYSSWRNFRQVDAASRSKIILLQAGFWLTFIMFSATKFQLDHYTNIIMPFAAIICANFICQLSESKIIRLAKIQAGLSYLIMLLAIVIALVIFKLSLGSLLALIPLVIFISCIIWRNKTELTNILIMPSLAILATFAVLMNINILAYVPYDAGYNIARFLERQPNELPAYDLNVSGLVNNLDFHAQNDVLAVNQLPNNFPYYLAIESGNTTALSGYNYQLLGQFENIPMEKLIPALLSHEKFMHSVVNINLILIDGKSNK